MPGPLRCLPSPNRAVWPVIAALVLHAVGFNMVGQPRQQPDRAETPRSAPVTLTLLRLTPTPAPAAAPNRDDLPRPERTAEPAPPHAPTLVADDELPTLSEPPLTEGSSRAEALTERSDSSLTDGRYWPGKLLDQKPHLPDPLIIPFPEGFISVRTGRAVLQLFIDDTGTIDHIDVLEVDGPIEFADLAKRTVLTARFIPGIKDHMTVRSTIKIEVTFQRDDPIAG